MQHIYMCDSKGLVTTSRGDELPKHKQVMARRDDTPNMKDLKDIVAHVKPHAIVGLTGGGEAWGKVCCPFICDSSVPLSVRPHVCWRGLGQGILSHDL